jgi:dipeptidyl aminopeptidase/acylaminoacyl peptidase
MKTAQLLRFLPATVLFAVSLPCVATRVTLDDLPKVVRVTEPQISPDGKTVAIVVARANLKEDRWDAEIVQVDITTKQTRTLTHDRLGLSSPRWSPDGNWIAYIAKDASDKAQIFLLPMAGGDSIQLTHSKTGASLPAWSPDSRILAFAAADEEPEKKDQAKFEDAFEVGNNGYLERSRPQPIHIWTIAATGGEAKRVTSGSWSLPITFAPSGPPSQITWSRDGRSLVFVKKASPLAGDGDRTVQSVDLATGALHALTGATDDESNPLLSPDGMKVAYSYPREGKKRNNEEAWTAPLAGGKGKDASYTLDRNIACKAWLPDSQSLLLAANDGTNMGYWLQPVEGPAKRLALQGISPKADVVVGSKGELAFTASTSTHAAELYFMPSIDATPVKLTNLQVAEDGLELGRTETVQWSSDKLTVDGVVTYPPGFVATKKYPLVLYIHGGPTSTSLETFSPSVQLLAAQGWIIFEPNYRGSDNEGNSFQTAIVRDAGAGPGRDVMAGVEILKRRGFVDESRIAVSGWSYGGYMTTWLLGNYPTVWKAAVAGAPVTDLVDQYTLSDGNVLRAASLGGSPYTEDRIAEYRAESPITYASKVKAPTLLLADVGDWRVTVTQSYRFSHALRDNGVTTQFFAYPVPGHFPADPIRARDVYKRWVAWLTTYLNPPSTVATNRP